jgi:hypothetical protein
MAAKHRDPTRERSWRETILDWQASGLSIRAYCRQRQLTETAFHYWRRELRRRDVKFGPRSVAPTFVPVSVIPATTVEVRCPSGHVVSLPNADAATLRSLFAALAPVPPC